MSQIHRGELKNPLNAQIAGIFAPLAHFEWIKSSQELMDNVREHVDMEESEMLVDTEEQLGDQIERLGAEMQQRNQELMRTTQ